MHPINDAVKSCSEQLFNSSLVRHKIATKEAVIEFTEILNTLINPEYKEIQKFVQFSYNQCRGDYYRYLTSADLKHLLLLTNGLVISKYLGVSEIVRIDQTGDRFTVEKIAPNSNNSHIDQRGGDYGRSNNGNNQRGNNRGRGNQQRDNNGRGYNGNNYDSQRNGNINISADTVPYGNINGNINTDSKRPRGGRGRGGGGGNNSQEKTIMQRQGNSQQRSNASSGSYKDRLLSRIAAQDESPIPSISEDELSKLCNDNVSAETISETSTARDKLLSESWNDIV